MSMQFASINSGSNGNCYYVGNDTDAVLIDAGISCREIEKRMKKMGLDIAKVKAIFISHEHGDHIKGLATLANRYMLPIYITPSTAKYAPHLTRHLSKAFLANKAIEIGSLSIMPFSKSHDAIEPHSFNITSKGITIGVFTDIGYVCENVKKYFNQCQACFLEANYDDDLLENGSYPLHLKNRIRGDEGHLSNKQALELFIHHRSENLAYLLLSHLSKDNNKPDLAKELFEVHAKGVEIIVASRYEASNVFTIPEETITKNLVKTNTKPRQLELFG